MNITMCSCFFSGMGGITASVTGLSKALEARGHKVSFVIEKFRGFNENIGMDIHVVDPYLNISPGFSVSNKRELERVILDTGPNVIHAHNIFYPMTLLSIDIGEKHGIRTVITNHASFSHQDNKILWKSLFSVVQRNRLSKVNVITAVSQDNKEFTEIFTDRNDIVVINNGVDVNSFAPKQKNFDGESILAIGRLVPIKRYHIILNAMKIVREVIPNANLTIAGEGPLKKPFNVYGYYINNRDIERMGLSKTVSVVGGIYGQEKIELYQKSHVVVIPSLHEAFGNVAVESLAAKTPVITSGAGGLKEIIKDGYNGLIVDPMTSKNLAESIIRILTNEDLSRNLSDNGFREVQKYNWDIIAKQYEKIYKGSDSKQLSKLVL